jgi:hypothetical protein
MSTSYRTYVGPYVRCAVGIVEVAVEKRGCTNAVCENHRRTLRVADATYCHKCGAAIGPVLYAETRDAVRAWEVLEAIDERLTDGSGDAYLRWVEKERAHIWVANVSVPGRDYQLDETDFALIEITPDQIRAELALFEHHFAGELITLSDLYGPGAISLHWGVVQDYT